MEQPRPETRPRLAHAVLDEPSRILKARKIVTLLGHDTFARARRILEIGCGSGVIAATLAKMGSPGLEVFAVDVNDNRLTFDDYVFEQVEGQRDPVPGRIDRIAPAAEAGTRAIGVVVSLDNKGERFRAGQYGQARVELADDATRLTVPDGAVGQA